MKWTNGLPTEPGYYWHKSPYRGLASKSGAVVDICKVFRDERGLMCRAGVTLPLSEYANRSFDLWAGPILMPTEGE